MNRSVFEGRFLVNMLGSMIRQDENFPVHRRMNWERLFRISDYHNIASAIYLAMLGATERVPEMWGERFFLRYQEAVRYGENYEGSETEILTTFNMMKLGVTVLESSAIRRLYPIPETAANSPLRLYISEDSYPLAKGFLVDLGYETDQFYKGCGEHLRRGNSGFQVELYHELPFLTKLYRKNMKSLLDRANPDRNLKYIRTLSLESSYVFRLAEACYRYGTGELRIREVLDVYLFYRMFHKSMNRKFIDARLREFRISVLSISLLHIADMWFGTRKAPLFPAPKEDIGIYDGIESRILSNGMTGMDTIPESQRLRKEIYDAINREERSERLRKLRASLLSGFAGIGGWFRERFPDRKYMEALYPELEKHPLLLPFYWIRRLFRGFRSQKSLSAEPSAAGTASLSEQESSRSLNFGTAAAELGNPFSQNRRKKVFWKPHDHSGDSPALKREVSAADAAELFSEEEGQEKRASVFSFESMGDPVDISKDSVFHSAEITEEEAGEDEEQELLLWEFPKLSASTARREEERKDDVVFREHRELEEAQETDERLLIAEDLPRVKLTSYQAVSVMDEGEKKEKSKVSGTETGTVDGREVAFSKWKFPKLEEVES